jgi:hypothetical protein
MNAERNIGFTRIDRYGTANTYCACNTTLAPVPAQLRSMSTITVPVFGAISYDALTSRARYAQGDTAPGPYPSISSGYRVNEGHCYMTRNSGC